MQEKFEKLVGAVYQHWKSQQKGQLLHPDDEVIADFVDGRLSEKQKSTVMQHVVSCRHCAE